LAKKGCKRCTPEEWRPSPEALCKTEKEIWPVYYKKASGKPCIEYNDAVEEALCFGWIDGTAKRLDEERTAQRLSPRKRPEEFQKRLGYFVKMTRENKLFGFGG